jgi:hypothetical protein
MGGVSVGDGDDAVVVTPNQQGGNPQPDRIVRGIHFIQEDSPGEITEAIRHWLLGLPPLG